MASAHEWYHGMAYMQYLDERGATGPLSSISQNSGETRSWLAYIGLPSVRRRSGIDGSVFVAEHPVGHEVELVVE